MKNLLRNFITILYNTFTNQRTISRLQFLASIPRQGMVLEIGPFTNPDLRGPTVHYFDVLDKPGLLARSQVEHYTVSDPNNVPEMDYVSPIGDLSIIPDRFSSIYSAHCIEHQPDLITHLKQVERLLKPDGRYYLTIPDKRYCFDALIAESDLALVVEAYYQQHKVHSLSNVIRYYALTTHNNPLRHWLFRHGSPGIVIEKTRLALKAFEKANGGYLDVHSWRFTPKGFAKLIDQLNELGFIQLRVERLYCTRPSAYEFYIVLSFDS